MTTTGNDGKTTVAGGDSTAVSEKTAQPTPVVPAAPAPASTNQPIISLPQPPPFTAIAGEGAAVEGIPMTRGGSKGAKKRAFKSLIGGEGATPGLEKRADPFSGKAGGPSALGVAPIVASVDVASKSETKSEPQLIASPDGEDQGVNDRPRETDFQDKLEGE